MHPCPVPEFVVPILHFPNGSNSENYGFSGFEHDMISLLTVAPSNPKKHSFQLITLSGHPRDEYGLMMYNSETHNHQCLLRLSESLYFAACHILKKHNPRSSPLYHAN